ncbi:hypothetical protein B0H15DRAFT_947949 [Mycena belliarum]|uniref:Uncharacterized protein n=1 Tax=Mycena belliarum TaxID=1033014 RepID=A0AAD6U723_9AGAR|nr:hypothetical protein B0H15DRAFT_947949 [Mycena belliae]
MTRCSDRTLANMQTHAPAQAHAPPPQARSRKARPRGLAVDPNASSLKAEFDPLAFDSDYARAISSLLGSGQCPQSFHSDTPTLDLACDSDCARTVSSVLGSSQRPQSLPSDDSCAMLPTVSPLKSANTSARPRSTLVGFGRTQRNSSSNTSSLYHAVIPPTAAPASSKQANRRSLPAPPPVRAYPASVHNRRASLDLGSLHTTPRPFLAPKDSILGTARRVSGALLRVGGTNRPPPPKPLLLPQRVRARTRSSLLARLYARLTSAPLGRRLASMPLVARAAAVLAPYESDVLGVRLLREEEGTTPYTLRMCWANAAALLCTLLCLRLRAMAGLMLGDALPPRLRMRIELVGAQIAEVYGP